ncbi:MAG: hypothetical protein GVY13_07890 [Alphaproteobacteria bacterium]|jgi:oxaloacetate decarboxylase alpha subunit|nr:hypothetical protein [Alphaproteobacteria bacterium]
MTKHGAQNSGKDLVRINTLTLRDGLQSTGVWNDFFPIVKRALKELADARNGATGEQPNVERLHKIAKMTREVGYIGQEMFWGQSFQKHMIAEISPFEAMELYRRVYGDEFQLTGLGRGVNAVGFRPYGQDVIDALVVRFAERGGVTGDKKIKMRIFDALNSQDNCASMVKAAARYNASGEAGVKPIWIEAALCYQPPREINKWDDNGNVTERVPLFTNAYYLNYARKQIAAAESAGSVLDSLVIKDMAGQLNANRLAELLPPLKELGLPVYLHMHATNYESTIETIQVAVDNGIAGFEVADWPLADGTSHASVRDVLPGREDKMVPIDLNALTALETEYETIFGQKDKLFETEGTPQSHRDDLKLSRKERLILWQLGIPGGAMPAVMDLLIKSSKLKKITMNEAIATFEEELERLQDEVGWVPLVTPMADIIYTQAIINMQNGRYNVVEDRFGKMILGKYGRYVNHDNDEEIQFAPHVIQAVIDYCQGVKDGTKLALGGKPYPPPVYSKEKATYALEMDGTREKLRPLLERAQIDPESPIADEALVMKLMEPPASTNLTERILLGRQQERMAELLASIEETVGPLEQVFADQDQLAFIADYYQGERVAGLVRELLQPVQGRSLDQLLEAEAVSMAAKRPGAPWEETKREVARILGAALQTRYVENNVVMAKAAKDIPFEPSLALYYADYLDSNGHAPEADVRQQIGERVQQTFQAWLSDPLATATPDAVYENRMLHAALSGDSRLYGVVPPAAPPVYQDTLQ